MTDQRKGHLTACEQLSGNSGQVSIIDCRFDLGDPLAGRAGYLEGHIPGAGFADLDQDLAGPVHKESGRHPLPDPSEVAKKLGELGVHRDKPVVVYDSGSGAMAARCWWILRWLGHNEVSVLDGGLEQWVKLGLPLESGEHTIEFCEFDFETRDELVVSTQEVLDSLQRKTDIGLLDARDAARYRGEVEPIDTVAGHIPGSRNLPFPESLSASGLWKSDQELEDLWQEQTRGRRERPLVMMCGSGVTACHLALSALQAGCSEPRLYVGSWSEWIRDRNRPIGVGEA